MSYAVGVLEVISDIRKMEEIEVFSYQIHKQEQLKTIWESAYLPLAIFQGEVDQHKSYWDMHILHENKPWNTVRCGTLLTT